MIWKISTSLALLCLFCISALAMDSEETTRVPEIKESNGAYLCNGIHIGDVRAALINNDIEFFHQKGAAAATLIRFHKVLSGSEISIIEIMFREAKNKPSSVQASLAILFALDEQGVFKQFSDDTILYRLAPEIKHIDDEITQLFFAIQICGAAWAKSIPSLRKHDDFRYKLEDSKFYQEHKRVHSLFFENVVNLHKTRVLLAKLFLEAAKANRLLSLDKILAFRRPHAKIFLHNSENDRGQNIDKIFAQMLEATSHVHGQNEKMPIPQHPMLKIKQSGHLDWVDYYKDEAGFPILYDLVVEKNLAVIQKICSKYPDIKADQKGGEKLLSVETSAEVSLFIQQFYDLNETTPAMNASVTSAPEQFVATPIENSFAFKQLFGLLEKQQKDKFILLLKKQKNKTELLDILGRKVDLEEYKHLKEPLKQYSEGL